MTGEEKQKIEFKPLRSDPPIFLVDPSHAPFSPEKKKVQFGNHENFFLIHSVSLATEQNVALQSMEACNSQHP